MPYLNSSPSPFILLYSPHSWNSFNRNDFSIYMYVCTLFALYSPSYILSPTLPPFHWYYALPSGRTCFALLFSDFIKEKK
jgi:hypothetical protein